MLVHRRILEATRERRLVHTQPPGQLDETRARDDGVGTRREPLMVFPEAPLRSGAVGRDGRAGGAGMIAQRARGSRRAPQRLAGGILATDRDARAERVQAIEREVPEDQPHLARMLPHDLPDHGLARTGVRAGVGTELDDRDARARGTEGRVSSVAGLHGLAAMARDDAAVAAVLARRIEHAEARARGPIAVSVAGVVVEAVAEVRGRAHDQDDEEPRERLEVAVEEAGGAGMRDHEPARDHRLQTPVEAGRALAKGHPAEKAIEGLACERPVARREERQAREHEQAEKAEHDCPPLPTSWSGF